MIKIERTSVMNFENAIRGARNPMNSWGRMDSHTEPGRHVRFRQKTDLEPCKTSVQGGYGSPQIYPTDLRFGRPHRADLLVEGIRHV